MSCSLITSSRGRWGGKILTLHDMQTGGVQKGPKLDGVINYQPLTSTCKHMQVLKSPNTPNTHKHQVWSQLSLQALKVPPASHTEQLIFHIAPPLLGIFKNWYNTPPPSPSPFPDQTVSKFLIPQHSSGSICATHKGEQKFPCPSFAKPGQPYNQGKM